MNSNQIQIESCVSKSNPTRVNLIWIYLLTSLGVTKYQYNLVPSITINNAPIIVIDYHLSDITCIRFIEADSCIHVMLCQDLPLGGLVGWLVVFLLGFSRFLTAAMPG
jgi:hypothetical protein